MPRTPFARSTDDGARGEAFGLRVPTPARVCVGPDWGSLEEVFY